MILVHRSNWKERPVAWVAGNPDMPHGSVVRFRAPDGIEERGIVYSEAYWTYIDTASLPVCRVERRPNGELWAVNL